VIKSISLRRFKQFSEVTIPLRSDGTMFLAGGNNCGKSSVLHALAIWEFCRNVIQAEKGAVALTSAGMPQGLGLGDDEFSPVNVPSLAHLWTNLASQKTSSDDDGYTLRIRCCWDHEDGTGRALEFGLALANDRLFAKTTHSNLEDGDKIPRVAYLPPFAGITDREGRLPGAVRRRRIGEGLAGAVLRNILLDLWTRNVSERLRLRGSRSKITDSDLRDLRQTDPWERLQQALRTRFGAELAVAPFSEEYHSYIRVEVVKGTVKGYKLTRFPGFKNRDLMVEGSGFLQWLSVFTLAVSPDVDVLLLDEPDAHLHSSLQQQMLEELEGIARDARKQILVATHSTEILRAIDAERILELAVSRQPRFLTCEHQKVGLFAGLGSGYAPRIDALKTRKRLLLVEGEFDVDVLRAFASTLGRRIDPVWVEWKSAAGHKERKQLFMALKDEIPGLVAVSLRDRDDEALGTVGSQLADKNHQAGPEGFHAKKWRRRHVESYLVWPPAMASVAGVDESVIHDRLRNDYGIAVGDTFPDVDAPPALLDLRGKEILLSLGLDRRAVAAAIPAESIPVDIIELLDELDTYAMPT